jgi:hypothetical protein
MTLNYTSTSANKRGIVPQGKKIEYEEIPQISKGVSCFVGLCAMASIVTAIYLIIVYL